MSNGDVGPLDDRVRLVELLDRVLDRGVVLRGDVTISGKKAWRRRGCEVRKSRPS